MAETDRSVKND